MRKLLILWCVVGIVFCIINPLVLVCGAVVRSDIENGLVAYWSFDENEGSDLYDLIGGYNGSISNAQWTPGISGSALEFAEKSIVKNIPSSFDDSITSDFSLSVWIKSYGLTGQDQMIFDARAGSTRGFVFYLSSGRPRLQVHSSDGKTMCDSTAILANDTWIHLTALFNHSTQSLQLYINGTLNQTIEYSTDYSESTYTAAIGNNRWAPSDGNWRHFNGTIDELRFYNRALSPNEIQYLYNNPSGNQAPIAIAGGPYTGYISNDVTFSAAACYDPDEEPLTYFWEFGDGTNSTDQNPTHTYDAIGNYTVSLTVTDGVGAMNMTSTLVQITKSPQQPGFEFFVLLIATFLLIGWWRKKH